MARVARYGAGRRTRRDAELRRLRSTLPRQLGGTADLYPDPVDESVFAALTAEFARQYARPKRVVA